MQNKTFQEMAAKWPSAIVSRTEIRNFTGGVLTERTIANLDSKGEGIEGRFRIGRKIVYPIDSIIRFLENRAEPVKPKKQEAALDV
jgi:hypothetical protein